MIFSSRPFTRQPNQCDRKLMNARSRCANASTKPATNVGPSLQPPSTKHWFGTDSLGRDILSRVIVATRIDFVIALSAVLASFVFGGLLGACAGYFGGWLERVVMRACDMVMSFPLFVLAMGIVAAMGNSVTNIILATAVVNLPFYIRVARTEVNVRREAGFVEAARLAGNGDARILLMHLVPNAMPPMMVQVSLNMGWAILNAAGLSFIGLVVSPRWFAPGHRRGRLTSRIVGAVAGAALTATFVAAIVPVTGARVETAIMHGWITAQTGVDPDELGRLLIEQALEAELSDSEAVRALLPH